MHKTFIIGLPRTGTTSVSAALLEYDLKVAHTALTKQAFVLADVISDTPCFSDYQELDRLFPGSQFVYLERNMDLWVPSIQMLLGKMGNHLESGKHLNPVIQRCFEKTFGRFSEYKIWSQSQLIDCYQRHQQLVEKFFSNRNDVLKINIEDKDSLRQLLNFLQITPKAKTTFPHLNQGKMITAWHDIKHPNKVNSNASGPERRKFFAYQKI